MDKLMARESRSKGIIIRIGILLVVIVCLISCPWINDKDDNYPEYTGPSTMIDDFEEDWYEWSESIHFEDWDPLYLIEQEGRAGHWIPFHYPSYGAAEPETVVTFTHEEPDTGIPAYEVEGIIMNSVRAMHFEGTVGNPDNILSGYVKVWADIAMDWDQNWASDYTFNHKYILFWAKADPACTMWVSLPEMADGSSLSKGSYVDLTTEWSLYSIDLQNCVLSYDPETTVVIEKAIALVFYISSNEYTLDIPEGGTEDFDIWIDDIRLSD